jgi:uncharacterized membrane protein
MSQRGGGPPLYRRSEPGPPGPLSGWPVAPSGPPGPAPHPLDRVRLWLIVVTVGIGALTVLGLIAMWPRGEAPDLGDLPPRSYVHATITSVDDDACPGIEVPGQDACLRYGADLHSGPDDGESVDFQVLATDVEVPELHEGDKVILVDFANAPDPTVRYQFYDYQRSSPLLWLVVAFAAVVIAFGRLQGVRALLGLALSLGVLVLFVVPALLRDSPAVLVALVGTVAVAYIAIYLAHGVNIGSTIALAGSLVSLAATCLLALAVASVTQLSGLASEESQVLRFTADALDLRGLLIAGIVVGALGVLDDVTVSQVSTVAALRRADPDIGPRRLYTEAIRVGRDHVASTVNTLVLAYAGASLPLLLFFAQGDTPVARILTGELVATEVVRMLVGSIGLVLSVPATTGLAAVILTHTSDLPEDDGHGHHHVHAYARRPAPLPEEAWPDPARRPAPRRDEGWPDPDPYRADPDKPWF